MKIKVGDRVKHKLGGDEMIVVRIIKSSYPVQCRHYNANKDEFEVVGFTEEELELIKER